MGRLGRGRDVIIVIGADDKSGTALEKAKIRLKDIRAQTKKTDLSAQSLRRSWFAATAAVGALAAAFVKLSRVAAEQERVERRLQAVHKATGGVVGYSTGQLVDYATALGRVTLAGDEAILKIESMLLTFKNIRGDIFKGAAESVLDLAEVMETDARSAAIQLGKALNDPIKGITALTRVGVSFTDQQKEQIKRLAEANDIMGAQKIILTELQSEFGGTARAAGQTFGGQVIILKNNFTDLAQEIGKMNTGVLSTAVRKWNEWATAAVDAMARVNERADRSEAKLLEERVSRLKKELKGVVEHSVSLGEFVGESPIVDRILPSPERIKEINRQIDSYTRRIKQLQNTAQAPQAAPPLITPEQFAAAKRTALIGPLTYGLEQDEEGNILVSDTFQSDMAIAMQKRSQLLIAAAQATVDLEMDAQEISLENLRYFEDQKTLIAQDGMTARDNINQIMANSYQALFSNIGGMISAFTGSQKAQFIIQRSIAASTAWVQGMTGAAAAVAPPPMGLGPIAGLALSKKIALMTKLNVAAIVATSIGGMSGPSGGGGVGGGSAAMPLPAAGQGKTPVNITIRLPAGSGRTYTDDDMVGFLKTAFPRMLEETGSQVGDFTIITERNN